VDWGLLAQALLAVAATTLLLYLFSTSLMREPIEPPRRALTFGVCLGLVVGTAVMIPQAAPRTEPEPPQIGWLASLLTGLALMIVGAVLWLAATRVPSRSLALASRRVAGLGLGMIGGWVVFWLGLLLYAWINAGAE
jgi:hypothetical protein